MATAECSSSDCTSPLEAFATSSPYPHDRAFMTFLLSFLTNIASTASQAPAYMLSRAISMLINLHQDLHIEVPTLYILILPTLILIWLLFRTLIKFSISDPLKKAGIQCSWPTIFSPILVTQHPTPAPRNKHPYTTSHAPNSRT